MTKYLALIVMCGLGVGTCLAFFQQMPRAIQPASALPRISPQTQITAIPPTNDSEVASNAILASPDVNQDHKIETIAETGPQTLGTKPQTFELKKPAKPEPKAPPAPKDYANPTCAGWSCSTGSWETTLVSPDDSAREGGGRVRKLIGRIFHRRGGCGLRGRRCG